MLLPRAAAGLLTPLRNVHRVLVCVLSFLLEVVSVWLDAAADGAFTLLGGVPAQPVTAGVGGSRRQDTPTRLLPLVQGSVFVPAGVVGAQKSGGASQQR